MPSAHPGIGYRTSPPGYGYGQGGPASSPYRAVGHGPSVRHPAAIHAEIASRVARGEHPASATYRARTGGGTVPRAPSVPNPPSRSDAPDLVTRSRRLVEEFAQYTGASADVQLDVVPGGPKALAYEDGHGREHVVIDSAVADYALPAVVAHEMGHVWRMAQGGGPRGGPAAELEATYISGHLLRRGGYGLGDALRALGDGFNGSATHGSLKQQQDALMRGYYDR